MSQINRVFRGGLPVMLLVNENIHLKFILSGIFSEMYKYISFLELGEIG